MSVFAVVWWLKNELWLQIITLMSCYSSSPFLQVRDENGPPLPLDQQLLWPLESRLLHQLPAPGSTGLLTRCHYLHYDYVHTAVWEGELSPALAPPCFWCPVITVLGRTPTRLIKLFLLSSLQISFGWSTVKIDMSAVRQFQPLMPFSVPAFAATLFALGLALGTTIAVGMLFVIQVSFS